MRLLNLSLLVLIVISGTLTCSCAPDPLVQTQEIIEQEPANPQKQAMTIRITVGGKVFKADIEDSETGKAFIGKLPLTLDMSELNGNEKYCYGVSLPRDDKYFATLAAGDLMLYSGNCIVLFYGPAGGYNYTRLGRLTGTQGLKEALGTGSVKVTFAKE